MNKITFFTQWRRKSNVGEKFPFDVSCCVEGKKDRVTAPLIDVSSKEYDAIANTLDDFNPLIMKKVEIEKAQIQYIESCTSKRFVITDGKRKLAVDNQGFCYPRYKGLVCETDRCGGCSHY